ncbi:MAG: haloalkane dehalogenase [Burkholderiales bacterium]
MSALPRLDQASVLRTPEARFANIVDFPWTPRFVQLGGLRIACVDEGPRAAAPVLLMHGEPSWSYLYRKMIPGLLAAGHRVVAPDLVGFGRSDKPSRASDYSYANHVAWMRAWVEALDLSRITLFCQDWGSLIGLRLATAMPERFDRIVLANGALPTGMQEHTPRAFRIWRAFARLSPWFPIGRIVAAGCATRPPAAVIAAYDAPFPTSAHKTGARLFPGFVPITPDDPERANNELAWQVLRGWQKPFLTLFSDRDPITRGGERAFVAGVPGAAGQPHARVRDAGHFLQEDKGEELARALADFIAATPTGTPAESRSTPTSDTP